MMLCRDSFILNWQFVSPKVRRNTLISGGYRLFAVACLGMRWSYGYSKGGLKASSAVACLGMRWSYGSILK